MTAQSASKETTLDLIDRQVETPVSAARAAVTGLFGGFGLSLAQLFPFAACPRGDSSSLRRC